MRRVETYDSIKQIGDFYWLFDFPPHRLGRVLAVAIPYPEHGPEAFCLSTWTIDHPSSNGSQWTWDGDEDRPTLSPSLDARGIWHGFVEGVVLRDA